MIRRLRRGAGRLSWILFGLLAACGPREEVAPPPVTTPAATAHWVTRVDTIRRGDTLGALLLRNSLHVEEAAAIVAFVRREELFSLRRLIPGETFRIRLHPDGRFAALQYEKGPDEVYVVEWDRDGLSGYSTAIDYELRLRKVDTEIRSTVEEALADGGGGAGLTAELAVILAFEVDFLTEPRVGDRLRLLVEEKWLGDERLSQGRIRFIDYTGAEAVSRSIYFAGDPRLGAEGYFSADGESVRRAFLRSPLNYRRISSFFNRRRLHPILRTWRPHLGVDYAAPAGTPVVAIGDGSVILAGRNGGYGNQVQIRHGSAYESWYGHLSRLGERIRRGARVERGQVIGYVGSTGLSTGPHLDFRVRRGGEFIDPLRIENPREEPIAASQRAAFAAELARLGAWADSLANGEWVVLMPARGDAALAFSPPAGGAGGGAASAVAAADLDSRGQW